MTSMLLSLARQGQLSICFPSLHQVLIDVTVGWAAYPVDARPLDSHLNSWVTIGPHFNHLGILTTTPIICRCKLGKQMPSIYVWHSG